MSRPYSTALFAIVIAAFATGHAAANTVPESNPFAATALQSGSQSVAEDAGRAASASEPSVSPAAPESRERLRPIEFSAMRSATADLQMWSALTPGPRANAAAAVLSGTKNVDTMHRFARGIVSRTSSIAMSLTRSAMRYIGTPYVFGGTSPSGFDCSGYTQHVFAMLGIPLPRTADAQYFSGRATVGGMTTGDLVFFQTYEPGPSHVGIYVGAGKFIHSSSHGVMISRLGDSYWHARYIGAKRVATLP